MRNLKLTIAIVALSIMALPSIAQITEIGLASFYADKFDGRITASGDIFDQDKMTAAHRTLPFGSKVKVTNIKNKKSITVVINDRGPFVKDRVIDLSKLGARKLDFIADGVAQVKVEVISLGANNNQPMEKHEPKAARSSRQTQIQPTVQKTSATIEQATPLNNSTYEYYKLESTAIAPTGFGIQVASYQEAANLMKRCDEIKKHLSKDIIIQVGNNNGSKVYRIIIGTFASREAATNYNNTLNNRFKGSFVTSF
ncbi:MAG: septal ring lytic transglycosylase RlpA family protein [Salinivirgaceae bacterium]|jgi:rare lipoprotein A|nr:septal ring lytic transglycosylase RlpA family protein [Salinivirgaceae bacterium]